MKRIVFVFNHFQFQDGICRSAIAMANLLAERSDVEVSLLSLFKFEKRTKAVLSPNIRVQTICGFYFKGLSDLFMRLPQKLLYKHYIEGKYDIEIAFQRGAVSKLVTMKAPRAGVIRLGWVHTISKYTPDYLKMNQLVSVAKCNIKEIQQFVQGTVPVTYCYNPIDDKKVRRLGAEGIDIEANKNMQFVSVGRLSPEKGYLRLLTIVEKLKNDGYVFNLWIIGSGPQFVELSKIIKDLGIQSYVTLVGAKFNPHAYTSKADAFVCSSYLEGYSTSCTESIMLGVPVITTNCSGAKEIIEDAESGLLTDMDDNALYEGIKIVLDNPTLISDWKKTLLRTRDKFSARVRYEQLKRILDLK